MAPGRLAELVPASVCSYLRVEIFQISAKKMGDELVTVSQIWVLAGLDCNVLAGPQCGVNTLLQPVAGSSRQLHFAHISSLVCSSVHTVWSAILKSGKPEGMGPNLLFRGANGKLCGVALLPRSGKELGERHPGPKEGRRHGRYQPVTRNSRRTSTPDYYAQHEIVDQQG